MPEKPVITRFAPSPTGALHVGGARTALFAWAFARQHGGQFILRIEDTDQTRSTPESTRGILRDMAWLGLDWDQGPDPEADDPMAAPPRGQSGPYFQSQRLAIYQQHIDKLLASGKAYRPEGEEEIVRFRMDQDIHFSDAVYGEITVKESELEDFVIQKSDGFPTFHLAVVVDDALMGVTHVIRGQEHLSNTSKHVALQDALGYDRPAYAHTPSIMNPDGSKMSKRDKAKAARQAAKDAGIDPAAPNSELASALIDAGVSDGALLAGFMEKQNDDLAVTDAIASALGLTLPEINVEDFRKSGYLPEVLLNYIALLGWNPGGDVERFDMDFMCEKFSLGRINKANSKFDRDKLFRFNADTIKELPPADFAAKLRAHVQRYPAAAAGLEPIIADDAKFAVFCEAYQPRSRTLAEPLELGGFFSPAAELSYDFGSKGIKKAVLKGEPNGVACLREFRDTLARLDPWTGQAAHEAIETWCKQRELNMGKIAQPIRVAVAGVPVTPPIDVTLDLLGKAETIKRIDAFLAAAP